jgi:hypothetical protein
VAATAGLEARPAAVELRNRDDRREQCHGAIEVPPLHLEVWRRPRVQAHEHPWTGQRPVEAPDGAVIRVRAVVRKQQCAQTLTYVHDALEVGRAQPHTRLEQIVRMEPFGQRRGAREALFEGTLEVPAGIDERLN